MKESYLQLVLTEQVIELNWEFSGQNASEIAYYSIERSNRSARVQLPKDTTTFIDTGPFSPGTYTYKIEALDDVGSALDIEPATSQITIVQEETQPYVKADVIAPNVIELSWGFSEQNLSKIEYYCIERSDLPRLQMQVSKDTTTFTDTRPFSLETCTYKIEALDSDGQTIEVKQIVVKID